ncbi:class I SAM-dependent methyltransferase [Alkalicoccobacillus porphyridii]|uniref:Class I SAM-dependent methyltransferase n=1 Tax=Alkalicoccobacillus porphyridii TaxID=2597270 RepID=A0A554A3B3_9BACI|nr:class I SAM-dependent methyltransferase [Alkalicoccobacillus porphyridii]TSB48165.1 class I SAM-dependent methyltransferase [Alkalicoccobacillus porphyridii]
MTDNEHHSEKNKQAWNEESYQAWIKRFGTPEEAASRIVKKPEQMLSTLLVHLGPVTNKRILNLMGSNGTKAVPLAILGADVTVVDFSEGNRRYALELAEAASVNINYQLDDVLNLSAKGENLYDIVFAEMGILHYFDDLLPFFKMIRSMLKPEGKCIIRDFHPVSTKLITSRGSTAKVRKHKVTGNYFDTELKQQEVAFSKYGEEQAPVVLLRQWTLGEIVTSAAQSGLAITKLVEEPNLSSDTFDKGIPKTFVLEARRLT